MSVKVLSIISIIILQSFNAISQPIYDKKNKDIVESKIKQLNELFEGQYKIDFSKGQLTANLIKNGSVFRQDKMYLETLDPNDITYIKE